MTTATMTPARFTIDEEIFVRASLEKTFASLIAQMGRLNETPDGKPLPMILEPFPGGSDHHRGQLLVNLRLLDVPVPSVCGPTADEPNAFPAR